MNSNPYLLWPQKAKPTPPWCAYPITLSASSSTAYPQTPSTHMSFAAILWLRKFIICEGFRTLTFCYCLVCKQLLTNSCIRRGSFFCPILGNWIIVSTWSPFQKNPWKRLPFYTGSTACLLLAIKKLDGQYWVLSRDELVDPSGGSLGGLALFGGMWGKYGLVSGKIVHIHHFPQSFATTQTEDSVLLVNSILRRCIVAQPILNESPSKLGI